MLQDSHVATGPPAKDLDRAGAFSSEKLCLEPAAERPGGLRSERRRRWFSLFESAGTAAGTHTQMAWKVDDIEAAVDQLRSRGVAFERSTLPGCGRSTSAW